MTDYYERSGLQPYLDQLGFNTVGYGCTTCIGNSGPLPEAVSRRDRGRRPRRLRRPLRQPQLRGADPSRGEGELPRLAAARRRLRPRRAHGHRSGPEPLAQTPTAATSTCATCGRPRPRSRRRSRGAVHGEMFSRTYGDVFTGDETWRGLPVPEGELYAWEESSTYVRRPTYLARHDARARRRRGHRGRPLSRRARRLRHDRPHLAGRGDPARLAGRPVPRGARRRAAGLQLVRRAARQPRGDDPRHVRERAATQPDRAGSRGDVDRARPVRRGDDDLRRGRALRRGGNAAHRDRRARSTARARRATGPRRARRCSACAP